MSTDKTSDEIEKRLLLVSNTLEAATASLEVLVCKMREALDEARSHAVTVSIKKQEQEKE